MIHINPIIYDSKPQAKGRLEKEMKTYEVLELLKIPFQRLDHEPTSTIEGCEAIEQRLDIPIYKNLFLCNSKKTDYYLLVMAGHKQFKSGKVASQIGSTRLSFGEAEVLEAYLNVTPGSVSIMGLIFDKAHKVQLLMDESLTKESYMGCHPCINTTSLKIRTTDILEKFLPFTGHDIQFVTLDEE